MIRLYISIIIISVFLLCFKFKKKSISKEFYIVHTEKNCIKCFSQLNQAIHTKLGKPITKINYIFVNSNIISEKLTIKNFLQNDSIEIVKFKNKKKLSVIQKELKSEEISPFIIIVSDNIVSVMSFKHLFIKDDLINLDWLD